MATYATEIDANAAPDTSGIVGHPAGLTTLFFTEMWERFSYYGMRALLILFMVDAPEQGGLGFNTARAASIYGLYTGSVYLTAIPGGWVADQLLGARLAVLVGGILIALGHFSIAFNSLASFYTGLVLIVFGTGLLKPNINTMVGSLYGKDDPRRDSGFSFFYTGINLGAFFAPIVCGFLARRPEFKAILGGLGLHVETTYHWGFAAAGVGMTFGLLQYLYPKALPLLLTSFGSFMGGLVLVSFRPSKATLSTRGDVLWVVAAMIAGAVAGAALTLLIKLISGKPDPASSAHPLARVGIRPQTNRSSEGVEFAKQRLTVEEKKRIAVIGILFVFAAIFWMAFEQAGSSLNLFAATLTRNKVFGWEFDASYFQSVNSAFVWIFAPVFAFLWLFMGKRQPSSVAKFSMGLIFAGLGFIVLVIASSFTGGGAKVSPAWLIAVYFLHTVGELCLSPVGLSTTTKLAPPRLGGLMMGVWFLSISIGNYAGGWVAGFFDANAEGALMKVFGYVAATTIGAGLLLAALAPYIRRLMGETR